MFREVLNQPAGLFDGFRLAREFGEPNGSIVGPTVRRGRAVPELCRPVRVIGNSFEGNSGNAFITPPESLQQDVHVVVRLAPYSPFDWIASSNPPSRLSDRKLVLPRRVLRVPSFVNVHIMNSVSILLLSSPGKNGSDSVAKLFPADSSVRQAAVLFLRVRFFIIACILRSVSEFGRFRKAS